MGKKRIETSKVLADLGMSEGFKLMEIIQHGLSKADKGKINGGYITIPEIRQIGVSYNI